MKQFFSSTLGIIIIILVVIVVVILIMQPQWLKDLMGPKNPKDGTPCTTTSGAGYFKNGKCVLSGTGGPGGSNFEAQAPIDKTPELDRNICFKHSSAWGSGSDKRTLTFYVRSADCNSFQAQAARNYLNVITYPNSIVDAIPFANKILKDFKNRYPGLILTYSFA